MAVPLDPHPLPLTAADARHLLRRTGFGVPPARVRELTGLTAAEAARRLLDEAEAVVLEDPVWLGTHLRTQTDIFREMRESMLRRMVAAPLREKMTLFWHNHLPVKADAINTSTTVTIDGVSTLVFYTPAMLWSYYRLLHGNAFGHVPTLLAAIGTEPAMLRFLNGNVSTAAAPNQNYARELMELFTMGLYGPDGQPNFTETDVHAAARALTGWRERTRLVNGADTYTRESYFTASRFDGGVKTIFGQTGPWGYADLLRLVFDRRSLETAHHLARKLLAFFVAPVPDPAAEAALADRLLASRFEMRPVLEALFASTHFYAPGHRGALVKSPTDLHLGAAVALGCDTAATAFDWATLRTYVHGNSAVEERSHQYFEPPNVAGWPGHNPPSATGRENYKVWYAADDFPTLWTRLRAIAYNSSGRFPSDPLTLVAYAASDVNDPFAVAVALAEHLIAVPLAYASIPDRSATPLAGNATRPPPDWVATAPRYVTDLGKTLLGSVPHYEWAAMPIPMRISYVRNYLVFLTTELPEFLLM